MLALTRKKDEAILISPADHLDRRPVKLGIDAPAGLLVVRDELTESTP